MAGTPSSTPPHQDTPPSGWVGASGRTEVPDWTEPSGWAGSSGRVEASGSPPVPDAPPPPERVRIVLADVTGQGPAARFRAEFDAQSPVGEVLVRGLMRAQLGLAARLAALVLFLLGGLPLLFALVPDLAAVTLVGIRLPWLVLGVGAYPLLVGVGWFYTRAAERNERDFADLVERS